MFGHQRSLMYTQSTTSPAVGRTRIRAFRKRKRVCDRELSGEGALRVYQSIRRAVSRIEPARSAHLGHRDELRHGEGDEVPLVVALLELPEHLAYFLTRSFGI